MVEGRDNYVYIVEADPEAVARDVRRLRILCLASIPAILAAISLVAVVAWLDGHPPALSDLLPRLLIIPALLVGVAYFIVPHCIKKTDVMIGGDFINAPLVATPRYTAVMGYADMTAAKIYVSKGQIVGATIAAGGVVVGTGRIKDPGIVVRAVFERAPDSIKWRRSGLLSRRLSREEAKELIEKANVPDINSLLPPSRDFMQAEDLFSQDRQEERIPGIKGWFGHLLGGQTYKTGTAMSVEIPTPASRYVNFMLLRMFRDGETTRVLKKGEQLPTLTLESTTAEPPALQDVVDRLKTMCRLDQRSDPGRRNGTIDVTINKTPCKILCRFDKDADACCQMRLERVAP